MTNEESIPTVPWPTVTRYTGGGCPEGLHARVWLRLDDDGREVEYVPATPPTAAVERQDELHAAIMNLPCPDREWKRADVAAAYRIGHKTARHAAAELALSSPAPQGEAPPRYSREYVADMEDSLRQIAAAVGVDMRNGSKTADDIITAVKRLAHPTAPQGEAKAVNQSLTTAHPTAQQAAVPVAAPEAEAQKPEKLTIAYSLDEERYQEDFWELLQELDDSDNLVEGATYLIGDVVRHKASDFTKGVADTILECARDRAFDVADEWAEDFAYPVSQALRDDLERVVGEWADANLPVTFWIVEKTREAKVTAEDIAEFHRDAAALRADGGEAA